MNTSIKTLIIAFLVHLCAVASAQMYEKAKVFGKDDNEIYGWSLNEQYHQQILDSINNASNFEELPSQLHIVDYPSNIESFEVISKNGNYFIKTIDLSNDQSIVKGLAKAYTGFGSNKGLSLTVYGMVQFNRSGGSGYSYSKENIIELEQFHDDELDRIYSYYLKINDESDVGMKIVKWYDTSDSKNGHLLIKAYFNKIKELNQPHLDKLAEEEYRKQAIKDSLRNVEIQKNEEQRQKELEKRKKELINKYGKTKGTLIFEEKVQLGFNKEQALEAWGEPDDINKTIMTNYTREQWVYERSNYQHQYLYFENGVLTTIQD